MSGTAHAVPAPRVEVRLTFSSAGSFLLGFALHLSKGHATLAGNALPPGTPVSVTVEVPGSPPFSLLGVVDDVPVWPRPGGAAAVTEAATAVRLDPPLDGFGAVVDEIAARFSGFRILLVTGEAAPRAILGRYLGSILSCQITDVSPEQPLAADAAFEGVDLLVVDLDSAPDMGVAVMGQARRASPGGPHGRGQPLPVLVLAEHEEDRLRARDAGADPALSNPPLLAELQATTIALLARPAVQIA